MNQSRNSQREVWIQLLVALERLGCEGNGASVGRIARAAGISTGAVTLYTQRVVKALLGDSGYTATARMLTPYRNPSAQVNENAVFNLCFSRARVHVEHLIGILKSRWSSLRGIRTQYRTEEDLEYVNSQIVAIFVLHNIAISKNDEWTNDLATEDLIPPEERIDLNPKWRRFAGGNQTICSCQSINDKSCLIVSSAK